MSLVRANGKLPSRTKLHGLWGNMACGAGFQMGWIEMPIMSTSDRVSAVYRPPGTVIAELV